MRYEVKRKQHVYEVSGLDNYLNEMSQYSGDRLIPEEEYELARRIQRGDKSAEQELIKRNLRLVVSIAKKFQGLGMELEDLIQEGNCGLITAAKRYDPDLGSGDRRFSTYATIWIKQFVGRAVEGQSRAIRIPSYAATEVRAIKAAHTNYLNERGREPSIEEVAEMTGLSPDRILELNTACGVISLDKNRMSDDTDANESSSIYDMLPDEDSTEREIEKMEIKEVMDRALAELSARERLIVQLRFGLVDGEAMSLEQVGRALGVTRERIRQIEAGAIIALRNMKNVRQLYDGPIRPPQGNQFHRHQQKAGATKVLMGTGYKKKARA
jgi:RNA polymerase primary sigma factor